VLVLSRKRKQEIVIAKVIKVAVLEVHGDKVKLGITAPSDIAVDRWEVYLAKQAASGDTSSREQESNDACTPLPQVKGDPDLMPSWMPVI
jgi:carbon storage regulator